jgi:molybdenum cofactor cytidylyltransferase
MEAEAQHNAKRIGVLLAAGRGRRMGQAKQLLPWPSTGGSKPLVAAAFDSIASVCRHMVVVLGHEAEAVAAALESRKFHREVSDPDAEMFVSTCAGLQAAQQIDSAADVLLHPGDHPAVQTNTLDALVRVSGNHPESAIMPVYLGNGGHPVLIPAGLVDPILSYDGSGGLRQFWRAYPTTCLRLVVSDPSVVQDLDTPSDYGPST